MKKKENEKLDAAIVAEVVAAQDDDSMYRYEDTCKMIDEIYDEMLPELRKKVREKFDHLDSWDAAPFQDAMAELKSGRKSK